MRFQRTKNAFTLMEVNLAIFIMAVGLLAMVALYPLAYRESQQSKDDVRAAAAADCILNTLTAALSSRKITWADWVQHIENAEQKTPAKDYEGRWLTYCKWTGHGSDGAFVPLKKAQMNSKANEVFGELAKINSDTPKWPLDKDLACAIVAQWGQIPVYDSSEGEMRMEEDRSRVAIGVRVARRAGDILSQPIFYTEVHFQGDQKELKE